MDHGSDSPFHSDLEQVVYLDVTKNTTSESALTPDHDHDLERPLDGAGKGAVGSGNSTPNGESTLALTASSTRACLTPSLSREEPRGVAAAHNNPAFNAAMAAAADHPPTTTTTRGDSSGFPSPRLEVVPLQSAAAGRRTMGQNQVILRHQIIHFSTSEGESERANGRASGSVLTSLFLFVPDHSGPSGIGAQTAFRRHRRAQPRNSRRLVNWPTPNRFSVFTEKSVSDHNLTKRYILDRQNLFSMNYFIISILLANFFAK